MWGQFVLLGKQSSPSFLFFSDTNFNKKINKNQSANISRSGAAPRGHRRLTLMSLVSRISLSMSEASALSLDGSCCRMTPSPAQLYRLQLGFSCAAPERHTHPINTAATQQASGSRWLIRLRSSTMVYVKSWTPHVET